MLHLANFTASARLLALDQPLPEPRHFVPPLLQARAQLPLPGAEIQPDENSPGSEGSEQNGEGGNGGSAAIYMKG
jgi:hypothetical protein